MKAFLYKAKGALALTLAMAMFTPQVFAAEALSAEQQGVQAAPVKTEEELAAEALPQLTFEEALAKVKKHSPDLKDLEETMDMLWEKEEDLEDAGVHYVPNYDYKHWVPDGWYAATAGLFNIEMGQKQATIGKELTELGMEVSLKSTFIGIIASEAGMELAEENAKMQQTLYMQGYQLQIAADKAKDSLEIQKLALEQMYIKLNNMMGVNADQRYELVYDVPFTPDEMKQPMEQYINAAMKDDLTIAMMELEVETAKFNRNYVPYSDGGSQTAQLKLTHEQKQRALKAAKLDKEMLIRNGYLQIQDAEADYATALSNLTKAQADYRVAQVNYQAGNITKVTVDGAKMGVMQAELALQAAAYTHDLYVFMFENPSLLADTSGQAQQ